MSGVMGMKWGVRKPKIEPTGKVMSKFRCPMCGMLVKPINFTPSVMHKSQYVIYHYHGRGKIRLESIPLGEFEVGFKEMIYNKILHVSRSFLGLELIPKSELKSVYENGFADGLKACSKPIDMKMPMGVRYTPKVRYAPEIPIIIKTKVIM